MKKAAFLPVVGLVFMISFSCAITPTLSRTHLMDDIRKSHLAVSAGVEVPVGETGSILPDPIYEYVSFAPTDWLELGLSGHWIIQLIGVEAKIDVIDILTDDSPVSALILGGANIGQDSEETPVIFNVGLAVNYGFSDHFEVFLGAGSSTISQIPSLHAGFNWIPFNWLELAVGAKLAINTRDTDPDPPVALMLSLCPSLNFDMRKN